MATYTRLGLIAALALGAFAMAPNAAASECVSESNQTVCVIDDGDFGGDCQQYGFTTQCQSFSEEDFGASADTDAGSIAAYRHERSDAYSNDYNDGCVSNQYDSEYGQDMLILQADLVAVPASVDGAVGRQSSSGSGDYADCSGYSSGSEGTSEWVGAWLTFDTTDADGSAIVGSQQQAGSYWWQDPNGSGANAYCYTYQNGGAAVYTTGPLGQVNDNFQRGAAC